MRNLSGKLIIILGIIILGSITLAQSPVDTLSGDNTPIIERKRKTPKVEKEITQKPETPKQEEQTKNKPTQKTKKKIQQKPQYSGLKIYDNDKPKQPAKKAKKTNKEVPCGKDPKEPCDLVKVYKHTACITTLKDVRAGRECSDRDSTDNRYSTNNRYVKNRYSDRYKKTKKPKDQPIEFPHDDTPYEFMTKEEFNRRYPRGLFNSDPNAPVSINGRVSRPKN